MAEGDAGFELETAAPAGDGSPRRVAPLVVGAVALVLVALFVVLLRADSDRTESAATPLIGNVPPAAKGEFADGRPFDVARRKGSWVVLNFFTHDCIPCVREHSELIEFVDEQRALGTDGAEFYTIVRDSTRAEVDQFFADRGGDWPIVYDPRYEIGNAFAVTLVPETWIIDPNGVVRQRYINEVTAEALTAELQRLRGITP